MKKQPIERVRRSSVRPNIGRRSALKSVLLLGIGSLSGFGFWRRLHATKPRPVLEHGPGTPAAPGPWGKLEYERIAIEPLEEVIPVAPYERPMQWCFNNHSRVQVRQFLQAVGLPQSRVDSIQDEQLTESVDGILFSPSNEFIRSLSAESRQKVFATLGAFPGYSRYFDIFVFEPAYLDTTLQHSGLPDNAITLFRALLYKRGNLLAFSDVPTVLAELPDAATKAKFLKVIVRRPTLRAQLKVDAQSNVSDLADYWGGNGRFKTVQPLIQNLARMPGGSEIDIVDLLPTFVRDRIYRFPSSTDAGELKQNCHWTALNFFNDRPDDAYLNPDEVEKAMRADYVKLKSPPRPGDLILFRNTAHEIVHSASYIADKIVFTKNGEGPSQPWSFMSVNDLIDCYSCFMGPLSVTLYRQRTA